MLLWPAAIDIDSLPPPSTLHLYLSLGIKTGSAGGVMTGVIKCNTNKPEILNQILDVL